MKQQGFGLLEILITLVVLGVSVVGLVSLSKSTLTASQDGRRYEIAMRLAESKLDEFRNFNDVITAATPFTAYNSIASASTSISISGDNYALGWNVGDQYWNINTSAWQNTPPTGYLLNYPGRKRIAMTVSWANSVGGTPSISLVGYVSPNQSLTPNQINGGLDTARVGPKINYTPGAAPDVIFSDLGNGSKQETSKPSPNVSGKNNVVGKEVQFDTMTYQPSDQANTQQIQQGISTVSCACSYGSNTSAYLPGQAYSTATNQLYWKVGDVQSKQTGILDGKSKDQPALCTSCCKDHFDGSGGAFINYYAPLNTSRNRYDNALNIANSGDYIDACRFVRLDGFYRPIPDWNLVKVIVTTSDFLAKSANQTSYQNYIQYVVKRYIDWQKQTLNWTSNPTGTAPTILEFDDWLSSYAATGGDNTTAITINTGTRQLIARGIYVDILDPAYLSGINTSAIGYLAKVPFQDINLTMLAEWSMSPLNGVLTGATTDYGSVSNEGVNTIIDLSKYYFGSYSRGYLTAKKSTKDSNQALQAIKVKATVYQGNSGVTASLISPRDQSQALSTELAVKIDTGAVTQPPLTVTGKIQCLETTKNNDPTPTACKKNVFNDLTMSTSTSGASCQIDKPSSDNQTAIYTCTAAQNSTLVVNLSYSGNTTFLIKPSSLSIPMTPPASGQVISGPCTLLVENGVTNAANMTCSP